jgi:hypothetical protein
MPEPSVSPIAIYQLRVVLRGVSPLIWRRLLVVSETSLGELHEILQSAFGWSGEHLHRFLIHGVAYGIPHVGGIVFREDARGVPLFRFRLHCGERFRYEYDFTADWKLDVRLERALPFDSKRGLPSCIDGRRAAPPEECAGAWDYLKRPIGIEATFPATRCSSWSKPCGGFLIPMATATLSAISTNCAKRRIA